MSRDARTDVGITRESSRMRRGSDAATRTTTRRTVRNTHGGDDLDKALAEAERTADRHVLNCGKHDDCLPLGLGYRAAYGPVPR